MITNSITDIINVLSSHGYTRNEINFIIDRKKLYDVNNFYIENNSNIYYSEEDTLFCDTLINFDNNDIVNFYYDYISLKTHITKTTSYVKNEYGFLDEIIKSSISIKKDYVNYLNYTYSVIKTSFLNQEIIYKYYLNESIYNNKEIEKIIENNKPIDIDSFNKSNIPPYSKSIYSAERSKSKPNLVNWRYISNSTCLNGKNICDFENDLQNLMDVSIFDKVDKKEYKKVLSQNKSVNLIRVD